VPVSPPLLPACDYSLVPPPFFPLLMHCEEQGTDVRGGHWGDCQLSRRERRGSASHKEREGGRLSYTETSSDATSTLSCGCSPLGDDSMCC
jgi:hypothetical protein